jgi:hypothetical protein
MVPRLRPQARPEKARIHRPIHCQTAAHGKASTA